MQSPVQFGAQTLALHRFGLGARPGEYVGDDPRGWALDQLQRFEPAPEALTELPSRGELMTAFADYRAMVRRERNARQDSPSMDIAGAAMAQQPDAAAADQRRRNRRGNGPNALRLEFIKAANARTMSAITTETPFAERMVHFWSNHFAVSADKQPVVPLAGNYEFTAIRPNILGNFRDLLFAAVTHPAMMLYLDQAQSIGPNSMVGQRTARRRRENGRQLGLNENLAREVLELHTLGVRTGYSQSDVTELARALTGWTVAGLARGRFARLVPGEPGETRFVEAIHEPGSRTILGKRYSESGGEQAMAVLTDLARSPKTARHLATKLARHFAADEPPEAMIARLEEAYLSSDGDLSTVYQALVNSPEAWDASTPKFRSPWDWTIGMLRAAGIDRLPGRRGLVPVFQQLGQGVWLPGSPAGWGDTTATWAGPGALMMRVEVAQQVANRIGNSLDPRNVAERAMPDGLSEATTLAIARAEQPSTGMALLFASPEFLRR
ncbi:DUF1800 domain-containing protein [Altererythrobacter lutimaris]|uniref:DUF1800 domain-containing protein n=1 Tax=Altererythrobacter lutimaris TaxID=2743979 RepID=A0A850H742_9SPHN|nr:DUF1800 domain-containing protein [Altererythrobacter lutimaris]NVE95084.1 DUF1800 domain-containing protein [Altererythrobacter lutimaris]